jgi:hypothetical protein
MLDKYFCYRYHMHPVDALYANFCWHTGQSRPIGGKAVIT